MKAIRDELAKDRASREAEATERKTQESTRALEQRWLSGRSKARESGYTDEGLEKLEKWMEERGVADHSIAMPAFERENPPPEPIMTGGQRWNFFDEPKDDLSMKPLFEGNDDGFLGPAIATALRDVRNNR